MQKSAKITSRHLVLAAAVLLVLALLFWVALTRNTSPVNWQNTYYPAAARPAGAAVAVCTHPTVLRPGLVAAAARVYR